MGNPMQTKVIAENRCAKLHEPDNSNGGRGSAFTEEADDWTGPLRPSADKILYHLRCPMESLQLFILARHPGQWLASIDMKAAYHHVLVCPAHQPFFKLLWGWTPFQLHVLLSVLRVFTKWVQPLLADMHSQGIAVYPLLTAWSARELEHDLFLTLQVSIFKPQKVWNHSPQDLCYKWWLTW